MLKNARVSVSLMTALLLAALSPSAQATPSDADIANLSAAVANLAAKIANGGCAGGAKKQACATKCAAYANATSDPALKAELQKMMDALGVKLTADVVKTLEDKYGENWRKARFSLNSCNELVAMLSENGLTIEATEAKAVNDCYGFGDKLAGESGMKALLANGGLTTRDFILVDKPDAEVEKARAAAARAAADAEAARVNYQLRLDTERQRLYLADHALYLNGGGSLGITSPDTGYGVKVSDKKSWPGWATGLVVTGAALVAGAIVAVVACSGDNWTVCRNVEVNKPASTNHGLGFAF